MVRNMSQVPQTFQLGLLEFQLGHLAAAEKLFRQFLVEQPNQPDGMHMLGLVAFRVEQYEAALDLISRAVAAAPHIAEYSGSLGMTLVKLHRYDEAIEVYRRALAIKPNYAEGHNNLGHALLGKRKLKEAAQAFETALMHQPNYVEAINNLGSVHQHLGDLERAITLYRKALTLNPRHVATQNNLAVTLKKSGQLALAIEAYRMTLESELGNAAVWMNLGLALLEAGLVNQSLEALTRATTVAPNNAGFASTRLTTLHYLTDITPEQLFEEHKRWGTQFTAKIKHTTPHTNSRDADRPLRVGYISADFREHSIHYFLENLLANHDPKNVEVFAYADLAKPDEHSARLQSAVARWRDITNVRDEAVAQRIRDDQIDILVDLAGHSSGNQLMTFARKPAPVQISYLGYPDTTGMEAMDWRLTDIIADPEGQTEQFYTEKLLRLPQCFLCYHPPTDLPAPSSLPAKKNGFVTFGCFSILAKINSKLIEWWGQILRQTPDSKLMLKNKALTDTEARSRIIGMFREQGIEPDRLDLRPWTKTRREHIETYQEIDIALDTYPYHGTTISFDALWMGVPLVTLAGPTHMSRVGVSVLSNLAMKKMIAKTPEEYVKIAVKQAADPDNLAQKRKGLRKKMMASPLTDGKKFAPLVEAAYRQAWRQWCGE